VIAYFLRIPFRWMKTAPLPTTVLRESRCRGEKIHSISVEAVRDIVSDFRRIDFFSLENSYTSKQLPNGISETIDHTNATTISIDIDGKKKSVYIFYGEPQELTDLQHKLFEVLQIAQYVRR